MQNNDLIQKKKCLISKEDFMEHLALKSTL